MDIYTDCLATRAWVSSLYPLRSVAEWEGQVFPQKATKLLASLFTSPIVPMFPPDLPLTLSAGGSR